MGLSIDNKVRTAFFTRHGALSRGPPHATNPSLVCIDLSAVLRNAFPALGPGNHPPSALAHLVLRKYVEPFTTASTIVVAFDTYDDDDLHPLRIQMHNQVRHRKATEAELAAVDPAKQLVVNGRIYPKGQQPYPDAEVEKWAVYTRVDPQRAVAGRRGKLKLYNLVLAAMVREVAEYIARPNTAAAEDRTVIFDTPATCTDPRSVILVHQAGDVVTVREETRLSTIGRHGEADQKVAAYLATNREMPAVWATADYDAVAQCMCLELSNVSVCYTAPRKDKDRQAQIISMAKLPLGTAAAFGMLRDGCDYCRSAKVFNVHSEHILETLEAGSQPIWLDGGQLELDQEALFALIRAGKGPLKRKRKIYQLADAEDEGEYFLSNASAQQQHAGRAVVHREPSSAQFHRSIHEAVRTIAYWLYAGTPDSTTRPAMDLGGIRWDTDSASADTL